MKISDIKLTDRKIYEEFIKIKTLSPITAYYTDNTTKRTIYFSPQEASFYNCIINNARQKWISFFGGADDFDFTISPSCQSGFIKRATRFKQTYITAWHGSFNVSGNAKTLDFLYQTGIGSKNSQGFGMFEILN